MMKLDQRRQTLITRTKGTDTPVKMLDQRRQNVINCTSGTDEEGTPMMMLGTMGADGVIMLLKPSSFTEV